MRLRQIRLFLAIPRAPNGKHSETLGGLEIERTILDQSTLLGPRLELRGQLGKKHTVWLAAPTSEDLHVVGAHHVIKKIFDA